jgi:peroxisomal 3,2-trans-enoyl-CoA isomerase
MISLWSARVLVDETDNEGRGADVSVSRKQPPGTDLYRHFLTYTVASNLNLARAFYMHPKILVTALNGPVIGMSAAMIAYSDFIYATPHVYLQTPFASLGLVAEGGASAAFVERMGIGKANKALIQGRRLGADELLGCGFVDRIFKTEGGDDAAFERVVLDEIKDGFGDHLNGESMLRIKALIRGKQRRDLHAQNVDEVFEGMARSVAGIPQKQFEKLRMLKKSRAKSML